MNGQDQCGPILFGSSLENPSEARGIECSRDSIKE